LIDRLITIGIPVAFGLEMRVLGPAANAAGKRLDGACDVLDVLGYTMTPASARMAVVDALRSVGPPPAAASKERKAYQEQARAAVAHALKEAI